MPSDRFRMDHGKGLSSILHRERIFGRRWVWRAREGLVSDGTLFADEDGRPVDAFGLPIMGEFIDASIK